MNKLILYISKNKLVFLLLNGLLYVFYGALTGLSLMPAVVFVYGISVKAGFKPVLFALSLGMGIFIFFVSALLVFGLAERILSLGMKAGTYAKDSPIFLRWIIYSGLHTICINMILPFVIGSDFAKIYYKIIGIKLGEDVFINTVGLHDAYLLEIGDNVVIGGKSDLACHTFENGMLTLKSIKIGNNVLIGANTYIMPGVTIGDNCDIGANSLVRKNTHIPDNSLIMPLPAQDVRQTAALIKVSKGRKSKSLI